MRRRERLERLRSLAFLISLHDSVMTCVRRGAANETPILGGPEMSTGQRRFLIGEREKRQLVGLDGELLSSFVDFVRFFQASTLSYSSAVWISGMVNKTKSEKKESVHTPWFLSGSYMFIRVIILHRIPQKKYRDHEQPLRGGPGGKRTKFASDSE